MPAVWDLVPHSGIEPVSPAGKKHGVLTNLPGVPVI